MAATAEYYDELETRPPEQRETDLFGRLPAHIEAAKRGSAYFSELLKDVDADQVGDRAALAALPVTRKSDLIELQKKAPPLGGLTTVEPGRLLRIYQSPGPIHDPEGFGNDWWGTARALYAAGFRAGDIVHNAFSYHFTPAGMMLEAGARALGCAVFPAGVGQTELQVEAMTAIRPAGYVGTPSFLNILLDKADETGADVSSLSKAVVGGEAFLPAQREAFEAAGIEAYNIYASADIGNIAYETPARQGLVVEESLIVEIVRPGTGDPVEAGEVGEVVVTRFAPEYPLIRFATGDLSAVLEGASPCGRTNMRLEGWKGRADQTTKVRGMFVHPEQIADIVERHPEVAKARLVVDSRDGADAATLNCEVGRVDPVLAEKIAETFHAVCKLRGEVSFVEPGGLANDGKVIDDVRSYE